jgi:hypothetical protein
LKEIADVLPPALVAFVFVVADDAVVVVVVAVVDVAVVDVAVVDVAVVDVAVVDVDDDGELLPQVWLSVVSITCHAATLQLLRL